MQLSYEQVKHIAHLARIELTEDEVKKFTTQLTDILNYVSKLEEVNTDNVEPTAQVTGLENIMREDEVNECDADTVARIKSLFPETKAGYNSVPGVFDKS